jgi:hypothetical protein
MSELLPCVAEDLFLMPVGSLFAQELLESQSTEQRVAAYIMPRVILCASVADEQLKYAA